LEALRDIGDSYPKVILTTNILQTGTTEDGIKIVSLTDWLLKGN
jgi:predicted AAA+ superfamily ATPase